VTGKIVPQPAIHEIHKIPDTLVCGSGKSSVRQHRPLQM